MLKLGFIGAGTVGTALAVRLSKKGYPVVAVSSRRPNSARNLAQAIGSCQTFDNAQGVADTAEFIFITTPDGAIPLVASQVQWHAGQSVVHCSGADSTDVLEPAKKLAAALVAERPEREHGHRPRALHRGDAPAEAAAGRATGRDRRRRPLAVHEALGRA